ncbi:MAG: ABC transporter substrate-binding protein [Anaeroplasmataceae bacterium]|nr:ABC transporter substrate-binding protein [Anaeroplasmataceae bacterium]
MKLKKILAFAALGGMGLLASCSSGFNNVKDIKKKGKLVVATNAEFAPFEYKDGSNFVGIDMEIISSYADYLGVTADIQDMDFDAALISVSTNKADVAIAGITKNSKREETLSFTDSYYTASQVVIVKSDSSYASLSTEEEILSALSSAKAKIGCQRGTTGQYYIEGDEDWEFEGIADTSCVTYDNGAMAVTALSNGQIDAVIIDEAPAIMYCKKISGVQVLDVVLTEEEYAIAVAKGNDDLVSSLNEYIAKMKEDGSFETIVKKYYGQ